MTSYEFIEVDVPRPKVQRITFNRPDKRNAINAGMRNELLAALQAADGDENIHVSIIRGAGPCFSSGYDLTGGGLIGDSPGHATPGDGQWARFATDAWLSIWDLAKPVIAQIHGYALAGASELAAGCDLVYCASDAQIGHPVTRVLSTPDFNYHPWLVGFRHSMELMLTGESISGDEAARIGFANRAYEPDELEDQVLAIAEKVAGVAPDLQQINKRSVHRSMETMGVRAAIRNATEFQALAGHAPSVQAFKQNALENIKKAVKGDD